MILLKRKKNDELEVMKEMLKKVDLFHISTISHHRTVPGIISLIIELI